MLTHLSLGVLWVWGHVWAFMWPIYLCIIYVATRVFITWVRKGGTLDPPLLPKNNSPFLWSNVASSILRHPLTIAVKYKMALCDSFTGIKAHSRLLTG